MSRAADGGSAGGERGADDGETRLTTVACVPARDGDVVMVAAEFRYRPSDCLAATLVLGSAEEACVMWTFAWDLLRRGLAGPAGEGDVAVRPVAGAVPLIEVDLAAGPAVQLFFPAHDIGSFVHRTQPRAAADAYRVGPALDAELAAIMEEA